MCGIAGFFSVEIPLEQRKSKLEKMLLSILHRGPDGSGFFFNEVIGFAHARLAVIDIEHGQQPMSSLGGKYITSFNGEIYNYKELVYWIEKQGGKLETNSDTEVIPWLYHFEGIKGWRRLRGMFAFSLWDNEYKKAYLVRDHCGIKPLFYHVDNNKSVYFSSEAKAILTIKNGFELNLNALHGLMNLRYLPGQQTLFSGINQLEPGTILEYTPLKGNKFFKLPLNDVNSFVLDDLDEELISTINLHSIADVPVSSYLSGGIDSAFISAILSKKNPNLNTYTLNIGDDPNEGVNAQKTAEYLSVKNNIKSLAQQVTIEDLKRVIFHLETPKVNALQIDLLASFASESEKVVLSGLGADELFCGYNAHSIFDRTLKFPPLLSSVFAKTGKFLTQKASFSWSESFRFFNMLDNNKKPHIAYGILRNCWDSPKLRREIYGERLLDAKLDNIFDWIGEQWQHKLPPLAAMQQFEWDNKMVNDLLWQEDRLSMAYGLEVRTPFVDQELYRKISPYWGDVIYHNQTKKYFLKKSAKHYLNNEILSRKKSGFQVSSHEFFHLQLKPLINQYLTEDKVNSIGLFNYNFIKKVVNTSASKKYRWHYFILYLMLGTHIWVELFENEQQK
ncbi:asparagine synthase (glutamine-hydrolyzing) [Colwellia sp. TT2012]|uniref:asparagine synthase (glutamine-hydrolyzing) n=1 Tax=Colwellia sp. TT2012 TaxID=1720342 RepID=UPI00070E3AE6|nr:asparagine synthase (glutamine-hydrolyzing) [Colwellia sp. TT2012]